MRALFIVLLSFFAFVPIASSRETWIVAQDGSGDFTEIRNAIADAAPGDLILVKSGTYKAVIVDKPLTIVGSGVDRTAVAVLEVGYSAAVKVDVPDRAGDVLIASLRTRGQYAGLRAHGTQIRLVVWRLVFEQDLGAYALASVGDLQVAWLQNCTLGPEPSGGQGSEPPALHLYQALPVFLGQSYFKAVDAAFRYPYDGGPGIRVGAGTTAYIAETDSIGGQGGWGWDCRDTRGGDGGDGILVDEDSKAFVFGRDTTVIRGGDGGKGYAYDPWCQDPGGGNGGDGIDASATGAEATYSGVAPQGGEGGEGSPRGRDGQPTVGNVIE
ncbi:MAG: hypothetical protein AB1486_11640 [Planctomycetota bacterium]